MLHVEEGCWPFFSQPSSQETAFVRRADAMQYAQHIYRIYKQSAWVQGKRDRESTKSTDWMMFGTCLQEQDAIQDIDPE